MNAVSRALPPPVGGWDTREALADMPSDHAVILDNWFPSTDKVTVRKGYASHATGMSGAVESLLPYVGVTGSQELFAANGGNIYDVSDAGAVGSAAVSGMSNDRWQYVQIGTAGGEFLLAFNGADTPRTYNGSSWSTASITGPTATSLVWCNAHQRRLWVGTTASLSAWYLGVNSISGTATEFSLAGVAKLGGYIMAMGTWTRDAGDGSDDVAVFLTSEGEAIVYAGIDPSAAATWALIGVFRIGKPIGRRCMIKAGSDLIMVTQDGFVECSAILRLDRTQAERGAISAQINKAVNDAVRTYGSLYGWEPFLYPRGTMLMFNVPQSATVAHQYVFNTITKAPCRFTGMNAFCWALLNDEAYFGGPDGVVYKADTGADDNGDFISADALQAFSYFGSSQSTKAFKKVEPIFQSDGDPNAALDLNIDFQIAKPTATAQANTSGAARWGISRWGVGRWGSASQIYRGWRGVRGIGRSAALRVRMETKTAQTSWVATNFIFVPGGMI
jgi:hypothetical protein